MNYINEKIINAVIRKAENICPDSLALIGIYGSVATGDDYERSDLDLLILTQDDEGFKLATGFILDDVRIGYDIYCTSMEALKYDSDCHHAHLSKLLDSEIVYIKNQEAYDELCRLRERAKLFLSSDERFGRVDELIERSKAAFANACLNEEIGKVRENACDAMLLLSDAIMLYHGRYFKRGVKRVIEELSSFFSDETFTENMKRISKSKDVSELRTLIKEQILYVERYTFRENKKTEPTKKSLSGTYEEMYSNWRNKVEEAAVNEDAFSSFVNMCCLQHMISDISSGFNIGSYDIMKEYNPDCLWENVRIYDRFLGDYERIYQQVGATVKHFSDVNEFFNSYVDKSDLSVK